MKLPTNINSFLEINTSKPLHHLQIFWLVVLLPFSVALLLALPLMENLIWDFSVTGYKSFMVTFSFPLGVSSLSIISGVMIGRFHASKVKTESLNISVKSQELARESNYLSNYLNLRNYFMEHVESELEKHSFLNMLTINNKNRLFRNINPHLDFDSPVRLMSESEVEVLAERICKEIWQIIESAIKFRSIGKKECTNFSDVSFSIFKVLELDVDVDKLCDYLNSEDDQSYILSLIELSRLCFELVIGPVANNYSENHIIGIFGYLEQKAIESTGVNELSESWNHEVIFNGQQIL